MSNATNTRKLKSDMWKYFTCVGSHFAKCDICKIQITHKTTMSNSKTHVEKKYPLINLEGNNRVNQFQDPFGRISRHKYNRPTYLSYKNIYLFIIII